MDNVTTYFTGEKIQCTIGAIFAVIFIGVSVFFLFQQKPMLKGIAYVAIPLSILLLGICTGVIAKSDKDLERVSTMLKETPASIQTEELPRMEKVMKSFGVIKKVELAIFLIGLALAIVFWRNDLIKGVGIGMVIMGAALYAFDYIAEYRGEPYVEFLKAL
jgi:hypothetical protein